MYPRVRTRRLRANPALRALFQETTVDAGQLILPVFVAAGLKEPQPVTSMPGVSVHPPTGLERIAEQVIEKGVAGLILFGSDAGTDPHGTAAADPEGPVPQALRHLRDAFGSRLPLMADVCLCAYTDHGHCGPLDLTGKVDNDAALPRLAAAAVTYAEAGADVLAPSDMMDGRVAALRHGLDEAGFSDRIILSYAVKYASAFYGPFRDAAGSGITAGPGDRATYQMDSANVREALRQVDLDIAEGADTVMVKPGLPYLDVIRAVKEHVQVPVFAYQVSGEYAMIEAASARGWLDRRAAIRETLLSLRRAGADRILTYYALEDL